MAPSGNDEETNGERRSDWHDQPTKPAFALLMVMIQLCNVECVAGQADTQSFINPFRCSEVGVLKSEDFTVRKPHCMSQVDSLNSANYEFSRYGELEYKYSDKVSEENRSQINKCVGSTRILETHGYWVLNFDRQSKQIFIQTFLKAKCSRLSQVDRVCGEHVQEPYQVTETYQLSMPHENCSVRVSVIHDHIVPGCDYHGEYSLCSAERKTGKENEGKLLRLPSTCVFAPFHGSLEVLYRNPVNLEPVRKSAVYTGVALTVERSNARFKERSAFCDLLTMETLQLVPELASKDLRALVLLNFKQYDKINNWTHTTHFAAVRLLRDQHELHLQSCNKTETDDDERDTPDPLTFHYQNVTSFARQASFLDVRYPNFIDYYSLTFWKNSSNLKSTAIIGPGVIDEHVIADSNKVTVGNGVVSWKKLACQVLLHHLETKPRRAGSNLPYRVEELALVLQFNVSTALRKNATRNSTVSVMVAYMVDIHPNPLKEVQCAPGNLQPETAQLRVPISENYYEKYSSVVHVWQSCATPLCSQFTVVNHGVEYTYEAKDQWLEWGSEEYAVMRKIPVERANGPQHRFFLQINLNLSRVCDYSWLRAINPYKSASYATYRIFHKLNRLGGNSSIFPVHVASPGFWMDKRLLRAFASEDKLYEVRCSDANATEMLTYWQEDSDQNVTSVVLKKFEFPHAPYYTWKFGMFEQYNEVLSIEGETIGSYFKPSNSKNLQSVKQHLCTLLEHLPVSALGLKYVPSSSAVANLSLEFDATARVCQVVGGNYCSYETARIRLRLAQTTLRPWLFRRINCHDHHKNANASLKQEFSSLEVYSKMLGNISFRKFEYFVCTKPSGVEKLNKSSFKRFFSPEACGKLSSYYSQYLGWEHGVSGDNRHTVTLKNISNTCSKLLEADRNATKQLQNKLVFLKASFGQNSRLEPDRALLIMVDYQSVNEIGLGVSSITLEKSELEDTIEPSRDQLLLSDGKKQPTEDVDESLSKQVSYIVAIGLLMTLFLILLLVLLHYSYVTFRWKAKRLESLVKAKAADLINHSAERVTEEQSKLSVEQVNTKACQCQGESVTKVLKSARIKSKTLPNTRRVCFADNRVKVGNPSTLDRNANYQFPSEFKSQNTDYRSKTALPKMLEQCDLYNWRQNYKGHATCDFAQMDFSEWLGDLFLKQTQDMDCVNSHYALEEMQVEEVHFEVEQSVNDQEEVPGYYTLDCNYLLEQKKHFGEAQKYHNHESNSRLEETPVEEMEMEDAQEDCKVDLNDSSFQRDATHACSSYSFLHLLEGVSGNK